MKSKLLKGVFTASIMCLVLSGSLADARPGGPGHGGPGFRPGSPPGGPGFRPAPPPRYHHGGPWRHFGRDVLGGALTLGLGLGVAGAISNALSPTYVAPSYVPPAYPVTAAVPTYTAPVVAPVVTAPTVIPAPVVTAPVAAPAPVVVSPAPSGNTMYWCQASKNFYPFVTECSSGWEVRIMPAN